MCSGARPSSFAAFDGWLMENYVVFCRDELVPFSGLELEPPALPRSRP